MKTIIHENVFVCFLDVLGFKDLISNNNHDKLDRIFDSKIIRAIDSFNEDGIQRYKYERVNILSISDSIILWTEDNSSNSLFNIIHQTKSIMISCLLGGIPLRGAIASGPISVKKHNGQTIIIGKALSKAYELESKQNWSGCIIQQDIFSDSDQYEYLIEKNLIFDYQVPYKTGPIKTEIVIDWVSDPNSKRWNKNHEINLDNIKSAFSRHNKSTDNWDVKAKIDNTVKFFSHIIAKQTLIQMNKSASRS